MKRYKVANIDQNNSMEQSHYWEANSCSACQEILCLYGLWSFII